MGHLGVTGNLMPAFAAIGLATLVSMPCVSAEQIQVAAVKVNKGDKFELVLDDKNSGRMAYFFSFKAVNKAIKGGDWVESSTNTGGGWADTTNGRGHMHGFDANGQGADTWKASWAGECYPVTGADGKPVPHCAGGWSGSPPPALAVLPDYPVA